MRRGDLNQCSFAFRTIKDEWSSDYTQRTMRELNLQNGDVSLVTFPANPTATAQLRAARETVAAAPLFAKILSELGEGRSITPENMAVLERILAQIAAADIALDQAEFDLVELVGGADAVEETAPETEDVVEESTEEPARSLSPAIKLAAWNAAQAAIKTASRK
jgi:hypothetical protein